MQWTSHLHKVSFENSLCLFSVLEEITLLFMYIKILREANLEDRVDKTEADAGQWKPKLYSSASPKCSAELVSAIVAYIDTRRDRDMLEPTSSEDQSVRSKHRLLYCILSHFTSGAVFCVCY